jgi:hypothetical protein
MREEDDSIVPIEGERITREEARNRSAEKPRASGREEEQIITSVSTVVGGLGTPNNTTTWGFRANVTGANSNEQAEATISKRDNLKELTLYEKQSTSGGWVYKFSGRFVLPKEKTQSDARNYLQIIGFNSELIESVFK